jgi:transposase
MPAAYSRDLRERVVAACDEGMETHIEIAERFCVSTAWIRRLLQRRRETGSIAPKPRGGGQPAAFQGEAAQRLRQAVADHPDATLKELAQFCGVACSTSATDRTLRRLKLPRKKKNPVPPSRTGTM